MTKIELNNLKERICDDYCRFPNYYSNLYGDPDAAQEAMEEWECKQCVLNEMEVEEDD